MILTFDKNNDRVDFIRLSPNLVDILSDEKIQEMMEEYAESRRVGLVNFLLGLGLSSQSIGENVELMSNIPKVALPDLMEKYGYETNDSENEIIYS